MRTVSRKNHSGTPTRARKPNPSPLLDGGPAFTGPSKMSRMAGVLERLGCPLEGGTHNPLMGNKELAVAAMQSYVTIHGFFPNKNQLNGQGLGVLRQVMAAHGGMGKMKELVSMGRKEISLPVPKRKKKAAKPKPAPKPKPKPKPKAERKKKPTIIPSLSKPGFSASEKAFVSLEEELPPREFRRVMKFLNSTFESRMSREADSNDAYFSLAEDLKIPVDAIGRRLFFRKCDVPALLLAAKLETGTAKIIDSEIEKLHRQLRSLKKKDIWKIGLKLWTAREFWLNKQKSANFSAASMNLLMHIVQPKRVTDFFAETHSEFCTQVESPKLRRHSNLLSA